MTGKLIRRSPWIRAGNLGDTRRRGGMAATQQARAPPAAAPARPLTRASVESLRS